MKERREGDRERVHLGFGHSLTGTQFKRNEFCVVWVPMPIKFGIFIRIRKMVLRAAHLRFVNANSKLNGDIDVGDPFEQVKIETFEQKENNLRI